MSRPPVGPCWYAVHTKPFKEVLVAALLEERLTLQVFLPEALQRYRGRMEMRPFFPRYLFVEADLAQIEVSAINALPGIIHLVSFGGVPQPLPLAVIEGIRERLAAINAAGGLPSHGFNPGDRVRLTDGPLAGLEAVFQGPMRPSQRVKILLEFLGRLQTLEVPPEYLEPVRETPPTPSSRRTTRGRGRRIHDRKAKSNG
ncbi:MAG: hypothetical protein NZP34_00710 [Caldilineales bacterium]|nr:hypothetical protein [Caldilineales bacterium]MCX7851886.1 hypothetical protein [Caldilineales bacterium]